MSKTKKELIEDIKILKNNIISLRTTLNIQEHNFKQLIKEEKKKSSTTTNYDKAFEEVRSSTVTAKYVKDRINKELNWEDRFKEKFLNRLHAISSVYHTDKQWGYSISLEETEELVEFIKQEIRESKKEVAVDVYSIMSKYYNTCIDKASKSEMGFLCMYSSGIDGIAEELSAKYKVEE